MQRLIMITLFRNDWIIHHLKACCGRRFKLWSKDGRGSTVSSEVNEIFIMISAPAASGVGICIKKCRNYSFWLCEPTLLILKLVKVSYIVRK